MVTVETREQVTDEGITIDDAKNALIKRGLCSPRDVDQQIILTRRNNQGICFNDVDAAGLFVWNQAAKDPELRERLASEGVKQDLLSIRTHVFGGLKINNDQANLPRSEADLRLDQEAEVKFQEILAANRERVSPKVN